MSQQLKPYDCKYMWSSRMLEQELRKIAEEISRTRGLNLNLPIITHQLAIDLRDKRVIIQPEIIRFSKSNNLNGIMLDNKPMKLRKRGYEIKQF